MEGPKCLNFGRVVISCFKKEGFCKLIPKAGRVSSTFLLPPELIWSSTYTRGLRYHLPFREPIILTNYNFHAHVQYCITIHYHSCSIDKYRNVEGPKCQHFGRLGISCFEKEGFCKTHLKSWQSFIHIPAPTWAEWGSTYTRGLRYHLSFRRPIRLTNYIFHTYAHVQYWITVHYHSCSIDKYRNVEGPKCHNFGRLGISHFEKEGHLSSGQLDPS